MATTPVDITDRVGAPTNLQPAQVDANFHALANALAALTDTVAALAAVGGGVTTYAALSDKASVDLPSINTALAAALAAVSAAAAAASSAAASAASTASGAASAASTAQSTATSAASAASAAQTTATSAASAASTAQSAATSAASAASAAQSTATAAAAVAAAAAPGGKLVTYAGTGRVLADSDNGNVVRCTNTGAVSMTVPSGLAAGFSCVLVQGSTGVVTAVQGSGVTLTAAPALVTNGAESDLVIVPAATNAYTVYSPIAAGGITTEQAVDAVAAAFAAGTQTGATVTYDDAGDAISIDVTATGGFAATITGTRGDGNTLTAHLPAEWASATYQWQADDSGWTNLTVSATGATYVEQPEDETFDIRCLVSPLGFITNVLNALSNEFSTFEDTWLTQTDGGPVNMSVWQLFRGTCWEWHENSHNANFSGFLDVNGTNGVIIRDAGGANGVIEIPLDNGFGETGGWQTPHYPEIVFRSDSARNVYSYLILDQVDNKIHFVEWDGASAITEVTGTTVYSINAVRRGLRVTLDGANLTVEVDTGSGYVADLVATMAQNLTAQWCGLGYGDNEPAGATYGRILMGPLP